MNKVKVRIPATSANLGPGFDILGIALTLYNEIEVERLKYPAGNGHVIAIDGEGSKSLPSGEKNIVWKAMKEVFAASGFKKYAFNDFSIRLNNRIPLASGLGSSAAARLGGILVANALTDKKLSDDDLLLLGVKLEGHPDNVVPAMRGGLCVSAFTGKEVTCVKLPFPGIKAVLCTPDFELSTDKTRKVLPKQVSFSSAVFNASRVALFLSAFQTKNYKLLSLAMQDKLHQPYREHLIPGMGKIIEGAMNSGAYGVALSGAGPSMLAFASKEKAQKVGQAMQSKWKQFSVPSTCRILDVDNKGAEVLLCR